ncbi:hypothetical protein ANCCAN_24948 [Ancylostoma caninum]|uniref:G-protein coupled receptors family 1 profile domain-containing protein n=1 Tax=Ancylostoma caninum TaxID=29170 RepID=A0A368FGI9_ANCCA|nr:hypothetical protein ANCCAN_24948 [Ancylostoma caninum]
MNDTDMGPPSPLLSDYIEMTYLAILVILGIPLNAFILLRLIHELKRTQKDSVKVRFYYDKDMNPTTAVLTISWLLAGVCALPQLVVFETYEVFTGWYQCTDVWQLHRYFNVWPSEALRPILLSEYAENAYNITHLVDYRVLGSTTGAHRVLCIYSNKTDALLFKWETFGEWIFSL